MCGFNNPAKGLAGNIHLFRCPLLVQTLKVGKPDGLKLINRENDLFQHG
jgi:hypothetical protein